ncbi:hypothetical protein [Streptomyces sp. URMC 123]|uniref:hypothetical protein n=1 Tax=Streptomyces sp. URMC 123 TaxID=3423403 RepID=UPI003F1B56BE
MDTTMTKRRQEHDDEPCTVCGIFDDAEAKQKARGSTADLVKIRNARARHVKRKHA